jgi:hypothetical protein
MAAAAEAAASELLRVSHRGQTSFVKLPLYYPDGSPVTVRLDAVKSGVRVSDNGFAHQRLEAVGAERSWGKTASALAGQFAFEAAGHAIFADVPSSELAPAIADVACASWTVVDKVFANLPDEEEETFGQQIRERLVAIFPDRIEPGDQKIGGLSTYEWNVTAIVRAAGGPAVFQAVTGKGRSINKAAATFLDVGSLEVPPTIVAIVKEKAAIGPRLMLLAQAGARVIEASMPDEALVRLVA